MDPIPSLRDHTVRVVRDFVAGGPSTCDGIRSSRAAGLSVETESESLAEFLPDSLLAIRCSGVLFG